MPVSYGKYGLEDSRARIAAAEAQLRKAKVDLTAAPQTVEKLTTDANAARDKLVQVEIAQKEAAQRLAEARNVVEKLTDEYRRAKGGS